MTRHDYRLGVRPLQSGKDFKRTIETMDALGGFGVRSHQVVALETQARIDIVKKRLMDNYGYDEHSATDVLNYVASIFARGDAKEPQ